MELFRLPPQIQAALSAAGGQNLLSMTPIELARWRAEQCNHDTGKLTGYDCEKCKNRGYFHRVDDQGRSYLEQCKCMVIRQNRERMRRSGLADMLTRYTMDAWQTPDEWQRKARDMAYQYAERPDGWFVMAGTVGAGKTHLCTALCGLLLAHGVDTRYMLWRDVSVRAKAVVNDDEQYNRLVDPLKKVRCLYIDDLFKTGKGQAPTTGDVNLAFEILNSRYNDSKLLTIISTERSVEDLMELDEALGSRIYERAKKYYVPLSGKQNWRLK